MPYHIDKTPWGFAFTLFGQEIGGYYGTLGACLMFITLTSFERYIYAFLIDLCASLSEIDKTWLIRKNWRKFHTEFVKCIEFHVWIVEYV